MYKILDKTQFSEKVFKFRIDAPQMARHAHAGQFLMVRALQPRPLDVAHGLRGSFRLVVVVVCPVLRIHGPSICGSTGRWEAKP